MCNWLSCVRVGAGHFPILLMLMMVVTLALTYILAVIRQDVDPYFPYISDAASKKPESCVFSQLLNIGAFLGKVELKFLHFLSFYLSISNQKNFLAWKFS